MTNPSKRRGRPPAYDTDAALDSARRVFWDAGYAASSLDELSGAMSMNRPSVYGAFGDKEALYLKTLERYRDEGLAAMREALDPGRPLRECLATVYARSLDTYLAGESAARGCFLIGTATAEAVRHAAIRETLGASLRAFDRAIEDRFRLAVEQGELGAQTDVTALSRLASAIMHSLAVRARAGEPRAALEAVARSGADMLCGRS